MQQETVPLAPTHGSMLSPYSDTLQRGRVRNWTLVRGQVLWPVSVGILFLVSWQAGVFYELFGLAQYQLPLPSEILQAIVENRGELGNFTLYTLSEIVGGFLIGSGVGWLVAVLCAFFPKIARGGLWFAASLNALPIVALAPIMDNWFGDGVTSRMGVVAVITMATMTVNAYKGMTSIDSTYFELMKSYGVVRRQLFWKLQVKHSLPLLFSALKINMATSVIGALVGEFFLSNQGLGYLLADQVQLANMPISWACIVIAAGIGVVGYYLIDAVDRRMIPWHLSHRV